MKRNTQTHHSGILRGAVALCTMAALIATVFLARPAFADTASDLEEAQKKYEEVQAQLDGLAAEASELSIQLSQTMDAIEDTQDSIVETEASIKQKEEELVQLQDELAAVAVESYMKGDVDYVSMILTSSDLESFLNNLYYIEQIYNSKKELIANVTAVKEELTQQKVELQDKMVELEDLKAQQQEQMDAIAAKQAETQKLLDSLDAKVKELTRKNNEELYARAAEAAAMGDSSKLRELIGSGSAANVIAACYATPSPGANWCAAWVTNVFRNAGMGSYYGNACDMYARWCCSSDRSALQPGMIIAVPTNTCGAAGRMYGHVGIYIGNNKVMENIGYIATTDLDAWCSYFGTLATPRWGWLGGVPLS